MVQHCYSGVRQDPKQTVLKFANKEAYLQNCVGSIKTRQIVNNCAQPGKH